MTCSRCQSSSRHRDYVQVFYQEWICSLCFIRKAEKAHGKESHEKSVKKILKEERHDG